MEMESKTVMDTDCHTGQVVDHIPNVDHVDRPTDSPAATVSISQTQTSTVSSATVEKLTPRRIFKIIVIGDSNVGKTCLTFRFCEGKFPEKTEATIGVDFREKCIQVDKENIKLQIWDTAGQERFRKSMVPHYYRNVHAVIFVYDVTKVSSFENMIQWIEECNNHNLTTEIPRILVGNKCDIKDKHMVNTNVAQKFADSHNMPLFETSAKDNSEADHVEGIFLTLAHKLKSRRPMMSANSSIDDGRPPVAVGGGSADRQNKEDSCLC